MSARDCYVEFNIVFMGMCTSICLSEKVIRMSNKFYIVTFLVKKYTSREKVFVERKVLDALHRRPWEYLDAELPHVFIWNQTTIIIIVILIIITTTTTTLQSLCDTHTHIYIFTHTVVLKLKILTQTDRQSQKLHSYIRLNLLFTSRILYKIQFSLFYYWPSQRLARQL